MTTTPIDRQGGNVAMFATNRACRAAGRLRGDLVVTMRPVPADQVATGRRRCRRCVTDVRDVDVRGA